jgi:hypothetical protein
MSVLGTATAREVLGDAFTALRIRLASILQATKHGRHPAALGRYAFLMSLGLVEPIQLVFRRPVSPHWLPLKTGTTGKVVTPIAPLIPKIRRVQTPGTVFLPGLHWKELFEVHNSVPVLVEESEQVQDPPVACEFLPGNAYPRHAIAKLRQADSPTASNVYHTEGLRGATH